MSTNLKASFDLQKAGYEKAIAELTDRLGNSGVTPEEIRKDTVFRHLKAKLRQLNRRLAAISEIEKQNRKMADAKRRG